MKKNAKKKKETSYNNNSANKNPKLTINNLSKYNFKTSNVYYIKIKKDLKKIEDDYENFLNNIGINDQQYNTIDYKENYTTSKKIRNNNNNRVNTFTKELIDFNKSVKEGEGDLIHTKTITDIPNRKRSNVTDYNLNNSKYRNDVVFYNNNYFNALERKYEKLKKEKEREKNGLYAQITKLKDIISDLKNKDNSK